MHSNHETRKKISIPIRCLLNGLYKLNTNAAKRAKVTKQGVSLLSENHSRERSGQDDMSCL